LRVYHATHKRAHIANHPVDARRGAASFHRPLASPPVAPSWRWRQITRASRSRTRGYLVALAGRLDVIDDLSADWEYVTDADEFNDLIETAPTTFAGLVAWASYLDEFGKVEV
jgi:hypothetical protein